MLSLTMTGARTTEFRAYASTVYAAVEVTISRTDTGETLSTDTRSPQLDLDRYPEIRAHVEALQELITNAYLFEARVTSDPQQAYVPPPPPVEETPTEEGVI